MPKAFNAGKVDELVAMFAPTGELVDEQGTIHRGQQEIKTLLTEFFKKYPGAKMTQEIESIRFAGPVAIEEGTRTMTTKDGANAARLRYIMVRSKTNSGWQIDSLRDVADDVEPTPHQRLEPLAWLVGDWVNEGTDATVKISYRWSEDKNYLLADFNVVLPDGEAHKSTQRIGWDPLQRKIHSWLFDSDGGFSQGLWTQVEDGWVIKSSAVNPDGETATATISIETKDKAHYIMRGTDRIVGDDSEPDFEITVTRRPPAAGK